jgi:hypothetical protein
MRLRLSESDELTNHRNQVEQFSDQFIRISGEIAAQCSKIREAGGRNEGPRFGKPEQFPCPRPVRWRFVDEVRKRQQEMEWSGNFLLSCDIKEA